MPVVMRGKASSLELILKPPVENMSKEYKNFHAICWNFGPC